MVMEACKECSLSVLWDKSPGRNHLYSHNRDRTSYKGLTFFKGYMKYCQVRTFMEHYKNVCLLGHKVCDILN